MRTQYAQTSLRTWLVKKSICGSHTLCVDHEESLGTKQRLRKYTTYSEPLIELSIQRKYKNMYIFILISN